MGIEGLSVLTDPDSTDYIEFGGIMESATPEEPLESGETTDPPEEKLPSPPKQVDNPDLPLEGDPEEFEPEPVDDDDFDDEEEAAEQREEPNDLSGIDKEFDD